MPRRRKPYQSPFQGHRVRYTGDYEDTSVRDGMNELYKVLAEKKQKDKAKQQDND